MNEKELIRLCQQGNPKAQEQAYEQYADRLYRLVRRYIQDEDEAEDALMRAFVKAFQHIQTFQYKDEGSLEGWLRKIAVNESLMYLRKEHNFNLYREPPWRKELSGVKSMAP